jgi:hypothetical protein
MAASAALTIPLHVSTTNAREDALEILENTPGSAGVSIDDAGVASFHLQFPGNIDALVSKLRGKRVLDAATPTMTLSVTVQSMRLVDPADVLQRLKSSPAISEASYNGTVVAVAAVATTSAARYVFEEILNAGLMPIDMPTPAGALEFVL